LVALLVDFPQQGLQRGDVGTVLEVFDGNEHHLAGYLVEFLDEKAERWIELDITDSSRMVRLRFNRLAA
jgi:hypothetical protein